MRLLHFIGEVICNLLIFIIMLLSFPFDILKDILILKPIVERNEMMIGDIRPSYIHYFSFYRFINVAIALEQFRRKHIPLTEEDLKLKYQSPHQ